MATTKAKEMRKLWVEGDHTQLSFTENLAEMSGSPVEECGIIYRGQEDLYPNWGNRSFSKSYEVASKFSNQYGGGVIYITKVHGLDVTKWREEDPTLKWDAEKEVIVPLETLKDIEWKYFHKTVSNGWWNLQVCIDSNLTLEEIHQDLIMKESEKPKFDVNELKANILELKDFKMIYPATPILINTFTSSEMELIVE